MMTLIVRRLLQLPIILAVVFALTLTLAWWVPGNPLDAGEGRRPPPEVEQAMLQQYNLDRFDRFAASYLYSASGVKWVVESLSGAAAARDRAAAQAGQAPPIRRVFDLGPSLRYRDQTVNEIIGGALPVSMTLGLAAMLVATVIGTAAGVLGAVKPNSWVDLSTLVVALVGISLPTFVIGTALLLVFTVWLAWLPPAEWGPRGMILPTLTLALPFAAYIARLTRMGMLDVLGQDFIRTARAKGVSESRVLLKHALKNAFLPVLSYLGPATALAMTGSFVVERVFTVPGLGQHFVEGVLNKDLFIILGVVMVFSTMLIVFNLAVDVMYRWVDPRIE